MQATKNIFIGITVLMVLTVSGQAVAAQNVKGAVLNQFTAVSVGPSTIPADGDVNPYGVAAVPTTVGNLTAGHILVSNFNNSGNLQGTGTTIVDVSPDLSSVTQFARIDPAALPGLCPGGVGLTTALVVLRSGWVIVGSLPTTDGTSATASSGCLIVIDSMGNPVETFFGSLINGPWDMVAADNGGEAKLFVTNVLNGTVVASPNVVNGGTVLRIDLVIPTDGMPSIESMTIIGSGFPERTDPAALVIGPTGVGLSPNFRQEGLLYVADSLNNRIAAIPNALNRTTSAGTGFTVSEGGSLNDPLGLVVAPNGHILTVNGNDGFITEITPQGRQIATRQLDNTGTPPGSGTLFGLAFVPGVGVYFVDDGSNTLNLLH